MWTQPVSSYKIRSRCSIFSGVQCPYKWLIELQKTIPTFIQDGPFKSGRIHVTWVSLQTWDYYMNVLKLSRKNYFNGLNRNPVWEKRRKQRTSFLHSTKPQNRWPVIVEEYKSIRHYEAQHKRQNEACGARYKTGAVFFLKSDSKISKNTKKLKRCFKTFQPCTCPSDKGSMKP